MARPKISEKERATRTLFRAFTELSNFAEFQRDEILKDVQDRLEESYPNIAKRLAYCSFERTLSTKPINNPND